MEDSRIRVFLSKIYVDDQNLLFALLKRGTRWNGARLAWSKEDEEIDDERNEPDDKRCMREIKALSNSIRGDIQMEEDVASNYEDKKLPILDIKAWKEKYVDDKGVRRNRIVTEFYEKKMVGERMLMEKSALPKKVKITSLAQMVIKRCTNQTGRKS